MLPAWVIVVFTVEYFLLASHISFAICVACEMRKGTLLNGAFFVIYILQTGANVADHLVVSRSDIKSVGCRVAMKRSLISGYLCLRPS